GAARAQTTGASTLTATNFTLTLTRADGHTLTSDELAIYFSHARCACPTNLTATLAINSDAAATLASTDTVDAQFMIGNNCDNTDVTCPTIGSTLTLSAATTSGDTSVPTSEFFDVAASGNCNGATTSTRFWAIVRANGALLSSQPSFAVT